MRHHGSAYGYNDSESDSEFSESDSGDSELDSEDSDRNFDYRHHKYQPTRRHGHSDARNLSPPRRVHHHHAKPKDLAMPPRSRKHSSHTKPTQRSKSDASHVKPDSSQEVVKRERQNVPIQPPFFTTADVIAPWPPVFQEPVGERNVTFLFNPGHATIHPKLMNEGNLVVLGRKDQVSYAPSVSAAPPVDTTTCSRCHRSSGSETDLKLHNQVSPNYCSVHMECFGSWQDHIESKTHLSCPWPTCPKRNLLWADDENFLEHWEAEHEHRISSPKKKARQAEELEEERSKTTQLTKKVGRLDDENRQLRQEKQNRLKEENLRLNEENYRLKSDRMHRRRPDPTPCCIL
jgi:hypothetical protein